MLLIDGCLIVLHYPDNHSATEYQRHCGMQMRLFARQFYFYCLQLQKKVMKGDSI